LPWYYIKQSNIDVFISHHHICGHNGDVVGVMIEHDVSISLRGLHTSNMPKILIGTDEVVIDIVAYLVLPQAT
ncbi:hypothetical protein ACJX0J_011316, partial [Zea mays]